MVKVDVLGSGSRGNCMFVQAGRTRVLVDAGFSGAEIERRLHAIGERADDLDAILLTHEHGDHARGAGALAPRHHVPVACAAETLAAAGLTEGRGIPEWIQLVAGQPIAIGDLGVEPFSVPHDAELTLGFRLKGEGMSIGYATDLGHVTPVVRDRLSSCNVLVLESNHDVDMLLDGDYPWSLKQRVCGKHGHLSNEASAQLLEEVLDGEAQVVALAHLSENNNQPDLALVQARRALERCGREGLRLMTVAQDRVTAIAVA